MSKRPRDDDSGLSGLGSNFFSGESAGRSRAGPASKRFRGAAGMPVPAGFGGGDDDDYEDSRGGTRDGPDDEADRTELDAKQKRRRGGVIEEVADRDIPLDSDDDVAEDSDDESDDEGGKKARSRKKEDKGRDREMVHTARLKQQGIELDGEGGEEGAEEFQDFMRKADGKSSSSSSREDKSGESLDERRKKWQQMEKLFGKSAFTDLDPFTMDDEGYYNEEGKFVKGESVSDAWLTAHDEAKKTERDTKAKIEDKARERRTEAAGTGDASSSAAMDEGEEVEDGKAAKGEGKEAKKDKAGKEDNDADRFMKRQPKRPAPAPADDKPFDPFEARRTLLKHMKPGEEVEQALLRLGKKSQAKLKLEQETKPKGWQKNKRTKTKAAEETKSEAQKAKEAKIEQDDKERLAAFLEVTEASQGLLNAGFLDIYSHKYEKIAHLVRSQEMALRAQQQQRQQQHSSSSSSGPSESAIVADVMAILHGGASASSSSAGAAPPPPAAAARPKAAAAPKPPPKPFKF